MTNTKTPKDAKAEPFKIDWPKELDPQPICEVRFSPTKKALVFEVKRVRLGFFHPMMPPEPPVTVTEYFAVVRNVDGSPLGAYPNPRSETFEDLADIRRFIERRAAETDA